MDASLQPQAWIVTAASGIGSVTFAAGRNRSVLEVIARSDDLLERETAYLTLTAGANYTPAGRTRAEVMLYDGPTWTLYELTSNVYDTYLHTYFPAVAAKAWAINHESNPKIAGWASLPASYMQPAYQKLGWWLWSNG